MALDVIMYHYVRDFKSSFYKNISGLDVHEFENQIRYLKDNYTILNPSEAKEMILGSHKFDKQYCWLTFDDGYIDHYNFVRPILNRYNIHGSFFPPVVTTNQGVVLDVNKIHFILSQIGDSTLLLKEIKNLYETFKEHSDEDFQSLVSSINTVHKHSKPDTIKSKRLLQRVIRPAIREKICDSLFAKYVTKDEATFSSELYMSDKMLQELSSEGHEIGSHGVNHHYLNLLSKDEQEFEIKNSKIYLDNIGVLPKDWTMCYPYGAYNEITIDLLKKYSCSIALADTSTSPDYEKYCQHTVPRYDTNDYPKSY